MFNSMQGVDAIFGGFAAGLNAIRARNEERDNIRYFAARCREMEQWGEQGWDNVKRLRSENQRLSAANLVLVQKAKQDARWYTNLREFLNMVQSDVVDLKQEIARLKRRT